MLKSKSGALQLQERDFALLRGLFESRVMTIGHIATLYFEGKREYTKKRLQKLKAAEVIGERRRNANEQSVLFLTHKAFTLLASRGDLSEYPPIGKNSFESRTGVSALTLRHELEIMDVRAAFHAALAKSEKFSILEFCTWPLLHQFETYHPRHGADVAVKPDGFIRIHEKEKGAKGFMSECFLELDRSSKTLDKLIAQAGCYFEYYKSGGFAIRNGSTRDKFKDFPFRVLIVLKTAERRNNTAERLLQNNPLNLTQTWLTTFAEVTADPLGAIWIRPKDYREVTNGTLFDTAKAHHNFVYRRQPEREMFVEAKIKKIKILQS